MIEHPSIIIIFFIPEVRNIILQINEPAYIFRSNSWTENWEHFTKTGKTKPQRSFQIGAYNKLEGMKVWIIPKI